MEVHFIIISLEILIAAGLFFAFRRYRRKSAENADGRSEKYQDYLKSEKWDDLRRKALRRADYRCELCGAAYRAVHHVRYPKRYRDDHIDNLLAVCGKCHAKLHGIHDAAESADSSLLYSEEVRTGSHVWFFHVGNTRGKKHLRITESGKRGTRHVEAGEDILGRFTENIGNGLKCLGDSSEKRFDERIQGNEHTCFFEVKTAVNGSRYLKITESGRKDNTVSERDHVIIFEDEARLFSIGLENTSDFIKKHSEI